MVDLEVERSDPADSIGLSVHIGRGQTKVGGCLQVRYLRGYLPETIRIPGTGTAGSVPRVRMDEREATDRECGLPRGIHMRDGRG